LGTIGTGVASLATVGGAVACRTDDLVLDGCRFTGNSGEVGIPAAASLAGGVACQSASPTIAFCLFEANVGTSTVDLAGDCAVAGGLAFRASSASMTSCTLVGNSGYRLEGGAAGGVDCQQDASPTIENTIIAFNSQGAAVHCFSGGSAALTCTDIYGNEGGDWVGCIADQVGVNGNLDSDPMFCGIFNPEEPLGLNAQSPCAPENSMGCELIGAVPVACESITLIPPSDLVAQTQGPELISLNWIDNSEQEEEYVVERKDGIGDPWLVASTLPQNTDSWNDETVQVGHIYYYRIRARFEDLFSNPSNYAHTGLVRSPRCQPA